MSAVVNVLRGAVVESSHQVDVAVVDADERMRAQAGEPDRVCFARSVTKPVQAVPLVADGAIEKFGISDAELALCAGSHGGETKHVDAARSILRKIGADEQALACGAHPPFHEPARRELADSGEKPRAVHNNCSGKHAGMLALARLHGWPLAGYQDLEHPVQRRMIDEVAKRTKLAADEIPIAVDGCGVPTYALPVRAMAHLFANLAEAARGGQGPAARVVDAMIRHPDYVAGTDRLCTELMRQTAGRVFAKVGAEGVYCAGVPGAELGVALKVRDGARRAAKPALIGVLHALGLLSDDEVAALSRYAEPDVTNTRGERVGGLRAVVELEPGDG